MVNQVGFTKTEYNNLYSKLVGYYKKIIGNRGDILLTSNEKAQLWDLLKEIEVDFRAKSVGFDFKFEQGLPATHKEVRKYLMELAAAAKNTLPLNEQDLKKKPGFFSCGNIETKYKSLVNESSDSYGTFELTSVQITP